MQETVWARLKPYAPGRGQVRRVHVVTFNGETFRFEEGKWASDVPTGLVETLLATPLREKHVLNPVSAFEIARTQDEARAMEVVVEDLRGSVDAPKSARQKSAKDFAPRVTQHERDLQRKASSDLDKAWSEGGEPDLGPVIDESAGTPEASEPTLETTTASSYGGAGSKKHGKRR